MEFVFALVLIGLVGYFVGAPFRGEGEPETRVDPILDELEAAKQAKYREIRDAELDHSVGKLDQADFARVDAELRRDAIGILKRIDERQAELG